MAAARSNRPGPGGRIVSDMDVTTLVTGAQMRTTNPHGRAAVVCVNGGQARRGRGNVERVARVARRPARAAASRGSRSPRCATGSSRGSGSTAASRTRARRSGEVGAERTLLLGFSMGGAVAIACRGRAVGRAACSASRRGSPTGCRSSRCAASASTSSTARSTAGCPGIPGVSPALVAARLRARAGARRRRARYELIPGALHAIALRAHWGRPVPLPRARRVGARRRRELSACRASG